MRAREKDDANSMLNENMFRLGVGLLALAVYKRADGSSNEDGTKSDSDAFTRLATAGIAPYIVTIIRKLGGSDTLR